jgi:hypothetical protein
MEVTYSRSLCDHDDTILFRVDWERPSINPEKVQLLCVEIMRSPPCPRVHSFIHQGSVKARHVASSREQARFIGIFHRASKVRMRCAVRTQSLYTSIPWTVILVGRMPGVVPLNQLATSVRQLLQRVNFQIHGLNAKVCM